MVIITVFSTKGGTGKTTVTANLSAVLADMGFRVLMIDTDVQPSLSKYFPLHYRAPNGVVEFLLGKNDETTIRSTISNTIYPNLDIIFSNNVSDDVQVKVQNRPDRAFLLRSKLVHPYIAENYDAVLIDTQGSVGVIQDAACFAANLILSPIMPETLSAREFISGTQDALERLAHGSIMNLPIPPLRALIYARDRTKDARIISEQIKKYFNSTLDPNKRLLTLEIPSAKAYKEATTLRIPVHCHEYTHAGKSSSARRQMINLVYELFPSIEEQKVECHLFGDNLENLLPEENTANLPAENVQNGAEDGSHE